MTGYLLPPETRLQGPRGWGAKGEVDTLNTRLRGFGGLSSTGHMGRRCGSYVELNRRLSEDGYHPSKGHRLTCPVASELDLCPPWHSRSLRGLRASGVTAARACIQF